MNYLSKRQIIVSTLLQKHVIDWYHTSLCHPGQNKTEEAVAQHLWWSKIQEPITAFVQACPTCQKNKRYQQKYGHLPHKETEVRIWDKVCIDLIGFYMLNCKGTSDLECNCVTMIDPTLGWSKTKQYDDKKI